MMIKFIQNAQHMQDKLITNYIQHKTAKEQRYREFLATTDRPLPNIITIRRWRNYCFIIAFCCQIEPTIQIFFFYSSMWYIFPFHIGTIYIVFGMGFILFLVFGAMFDWCIYRRWGKKKALLDWI